MALTLTADERTELERRLRSLKIRSEDARRARVILMLADGASYSAKIIVLDPHEKRRSRATAITSIAGGDAFSRIAWTVCAPGIAASRRPC